MTSDTNISLWLGLYRMKEKLRFAPNEAHILDDPVVRITFFFKEPERIQVILLILS